MGTFERLSVVVIGVILVMILIVAVVTWTEEPTAAVNQARQDGNGGRLDPGPGPHSLVDPLPPSPQPKVDPEPGPAPAPGPAPEPDPTPKPDPAPGPTPGPKPLKVHVVEPGETPGGISRKYYDTTKYWPQLLAFNHIEGELIRVGEEIQIPSLADLGIENLRDKPIQQPDDGTKPEPGAKWTVRKGQQDLPTIAQLAYGTTERWTDIWLANRETVPDPEKVEAGTVLALPK